MQTHNEFYKRWGKRAFDLTAASIGLVLLSPIILTVAVLVRLTSRGPAFFRQARPGLGGRPFRLFKFRTMRLGADQAGAAVVVAAGVLPLRQSLIKLLRASPASF